MKGMMLFRSKREEYADCHYYYSCNCPRSLLHPKARVVSNTDDIGQKRSDQNPNPDYENENDCGLVARHVHPLTQQQLAQSLRQKTVR